MGNQNKLLKKQQSTNTMVCTFLLFVLPALIFRGLWAFWGWLTGKKVVEEAEKAKAEAEANGEKKPDAVKKGTCPYHVVMLFLGLMPPADATPKADEKTAEPKDAKVKAA